MERFRRAAYERCQMGCRTELPDHCVEELMARQMKCGEASTEILTVRYT